MQQPQENFILDPEIVENELVHIDDQLITIQDDLEEISDAFLHLDEQLAVHIEEEENDGFLASELLESVDYNATPFDNWLRDERRGVDEDELFMHLPDDLFSDSEKEKSQEQDQVGLTIIKNKTKLLNTMDELMS